MAAKKGDFFIKSASAKLETKGLTVTGGLSAGSIGGVKWAKGGGDVDLTLNGTALKGGLNFAWTEGQAPGVAFAGSMKQGTTAVANLSGTVDGSKLTLKATRPSS